MTINRLQLFVHIRSKISNKIGYRLGYSILGEYQNYIPWLIAFFKIYKRYFNNSKISGEDLIPVKCI